MPDEFKEKPDSNKFMQDLKKNSAQIKNKFTAIKNLVEEKKLEFESNYV